MLQWSPDGVKLACADASNKVTLLDAASGKMLWERPFGDRVLRSVSWSPSGAQLACGAADAHVTGRQADVMQAAWLATECAHRMFKDGAAKAEITAMIAQVGMAWHTRGHGVAWHSRA